MSLPPNLDYLLIQFELIEQLNVVDSLLAQIVALLISHREVAGLCVFIRPSHVELLDDLVDLSVAQGFGLLRQLRLR